MSEPPTPAAPLRRAGRLLVAGAASVLALGVGLLVVVLGRGWMLEDACITEPPPEWAPEGTVVRGPVPEGLVTYHCEQTASPASPFAFTDVRPLVLGVVVVTTVVLLLALLWTWAVRRPTAAHRERPAGLSAG